MTLENTPPLQSRFILGMRVDCTSYADATGRILKWAENRESRAVCIATVNNVMESHDCSDVREAMNAADLVTPDGMPLVWGLRLLGFGAASRVYGPDLTPIVLAAATREGVPVGFYGASPEVLSQLLSVVRKEFPSLRIAYAYSPPFRRLEAAEDQAIQREINESGARILFVGMSSPKQDQWMMAHRGKVHAVMIGVGAAFDFLAGVKPQAPRWMMRCGLEWCFRLATEPKRLWRRYLRHNPRFVLFFGAECISYRLSAGR